MVRSRLPVPSLLGLFGALLMLHPGVLMGIPEGFTESSFSDPRVRKAVAFAVEKYNRDRKLSPNYSKELRIQEVLSKVDTKDEYRLTLEMVKTTCEKEAGKIRTYKEIQACEEIPGNPKKSTCFFRVIARPPPHEMFLARSSCTRSGPRVGRLGSG